MTEPMAELQPAKASPQNNDLRRLPHHHKPKKPSFTPCQPSLPQLAGLMSVTAWPTAESTVLSIALTAAI
jgi:hypothetical protein